MLLIEHVTQNGVSASFSLEGVGVHGLLFENAALKRAWMALLAGEDEPEKGAVLLCRKSETAPAVRQKRYIGYVPQALPLYEDMTPLEILDFIGEAYGIAPEKRARQSKEAMELTGISSVSGRLVSSLSTEKRRRVAFAQALLGNPTVIVCDEPFVGADAAEKREIGSLLETLGHHKPIVLGSLSADILPLCADARVLGKGGLRYEGEAADLLSALARSQAEKPTAEPVLPVGSLSDYFGFAEEKEEEEA